MHSLACVLMNQAKKKKGGGQPCKQALVSGDWSRSRVNVMRMRKLAHFNTHIYDKVSSVQSNPFGIR